MIYDCICLLKLSSVGLVDSVNFHFMFAFWETEIFYNKGPCILVHKCMFSSTLSIVTTGLH